MSDESNLMVPRFRMGSVLDENASRLAGRPVHRPQEFLDLYFAGERNFIPTFLADQFWKREDGVDKTYKDRFAKEYAAFKENNATPLSGTPLSELPSLEEADRVNLRNAKVFTVEALAELDGRNLGALGIGGRDLKNKAVAYLSKQTIVETQAAQIAELQAAIAALQAQRAPARQIEVVTVPGGPVDFDAMTDIELKAYIKGEMGHAPKGTPTRENLLRMAREAAMQEVA